MLGGADNPNGELLSYIIGADILITEDQCAVVRYWQKCTLLAY
ncbi:hypothetical protein WP2S18E08_43730 [Escherichia coli]|nr:hypothetical protein WP2S18E08_43730 [Escherichia coli]